MQRLSTPAVLAFLAALCLLPARTAGQAPPQPAPVQEPHPPANKPRTPPPAQTPEEELQRAIDEAGNDRAALVRNLEAYLKKYPDSPRKADIYRALVETSLQLRDTARAADYAERLVALSPDDTSMTLVAIQLLERVGEPEGLKRATHYATRILDSMRRETPAAKSPRLSLQEWEAERQRLRMTVLLLRGRLYLKQGARADARRDLEESYALQPNAAAAEKLGEIAELEKDLNRAVTQYAQAFVLADAADGGANRQAIRRKLGNTWRLAHGSEDGLGEYLLRTYDALSAAAGGAPVPRNPQARDPYDFTLRRIPDGAPLALAAARGKVLVLDFWTTWCGPCRALEPHFERVAAEFRATDGVLFLFANCDDDETLVPPYLAAEKLQSTAVFADGLNRFFAVNAYPTVLVLDRSGKIAYRSEGYGEEEFEKSLAAAIRGALAAPPPAH
ncbi:MAG: redoxin family protein [Acidobacteriia bacterium]|nr:redoxin family protein [Terriglobia bacterium]